MTNWAEKDLEYIWHPCSQMKDYETLKPIVIDRGEGIYLYDTEGKKYYDVISSWWCNLLGHCNPHITEELKKQADKLEHVIFANFTHKQAIRLCERLSKILPKGLCKFNFTDNGSSAIEASMKVSFQYHEQTGNPQKTKFMALSEAYHGETIGALSVGDCDLYTKLYKPILMDIVRIDGPDCFRCPYCKTRDNCNCECIEKADKTFEKYGNEMEFCQLQINYLDWGFQEADRKYRLLEKYDIPIWVMEPLRGGRLCSLKPHEAETVAKIRPGISQTELAFRFIQSLPNVKVTLSGMSSLEQVQQNTGFFEEEKPLDSVEMEQLLGVQEVEEELDEGNHKDYMQDFLQQLQDDLKSFRCQKCYKFPDPLKDRQREYPRELH